MDLNNRVALITGGARIGQGVAEALARKGTHVVLTYRSSVKAAQETALRVEAAGGTCLLVKADVTRETDVKRAIAKTMERFHRLDILINMASIYESVPVKKLSIVDWERNIAANLTSAYLTVLHAAPILKKNKGRVINFSDWISASGRPRYKDYLPYYAAKSGVLGLTEAQALELAPEILVNAIAPGPILQPPGLSKTADKEVRRVTPLGRWGGASEIAKAVLFLVETDFITGECIRVDGGRHLF